MIAVVKITEPCVNCEQDAAVNWLLCLECATRVDDAMLASLAQKYSRLDSWINQAAAMLDVMSRSDPRYEPGCRVWERNLRVYERVEHMANVVKVGVA